MSDLLRDHIVYGSWEVFTVSKRRRVLTTTVHLDKGDSWVEFQEKNLRNSTDLGSNSISTTLLMFGLEQVI